METPPEVQVVLQSDINEFYFLYADGTTAYPPDGFTSRNSTNGTRLANALTQMYMAVGEGTYDSAKMAEATQAAARASALDYDVPEGMTSLQVSAAARALAQIMPSDIIACHKPDKKKDPLRITFGRFSVSTSIHEAIPEEQARREQRIQEHEAAIPQVKEQATERADEKERALLAELKAQEGSKKNLTLFNHATLRIGPTYYYIEFSSVEAMLTARFLRAIASVPHTSTTLTERTVAYDAVAAHIWQGMPIAERDLIIQLDWEMYGKAYPVTRLLEHVRSITDKIVVQGKHLTRRQDSSTFAVTRTQFTRLDLHPDPPPEPYIFPRILIPRQKLLAQAGTTAQTSGKEKVVVSEQERIVAEEWAKMLPNSHRQKFTAEQAIHILDMLMTPVGKAAIALALGEVSDDEKEAFFETSHERVRTALGNGAYWPAWRDRLISGNRATRGAGGIARQVGGGLPTESKVTTGETHERLAE